MAIREVLQLGNPLLRKICARLPDPAAIEVSNIVADLQDTLAHWRAATTYGRAIAAPQIGVLQRIVFLNVDRPWPFINPEIVDRSAETMVVWDGCLSFLSIFCQVPRSVWIHVRYHDQSGQQQELRAEGDLSELLQHEIDHLDGVLTLDRMTDVKTIVSREEFEKQFKRDSPYACTSPSKTSAA